MFNDALADAFYFASEDKGADVAGRRKLAKVAARAAELRKYGPGGPWWTVTE
ncbi:MAG TPA: hypothetical protein VL371_14540 [Gemmataceae bacterium]|nr:hypothetical protein [Gemmataceae bacterium]